MTKENKKIIELVKFLAQQKIKSREDFLKLKQKKCHEFGISQPDNVLILETYRKLFKSPCLPVGRKKNQFLEKLIKRPVRTLSGVAVVSVLTKFFPCPGKCLFCPSEKSLPKSYLSGEPAVERAKRLKFNPYLQVKKRIETLEKIGHPTDKIELIVIGGSWSALPENYQYWFIKECFRGANDTRLNFAKQNLGGKKKLAQQQRKNEKTKHRIVGITLETRPDLITPAEIFKMRELGATRVEIGVQILDDRILKLNKRGHGLKEIEKATSLLKEAGFKVCYHLMFGLPFSSFKKDLSIFKKVFADKKFRPDMLKLYPCVVAPGSKILKLWQEKKYYPYSDQTLISLLTKVKLMVPPYVRINRVIRDIPSTKILAGSKVSNLREKVLEEMKKNGLACQCIRCREIKDAAQNQKNLKLLKLEYEASEGKEIFLSYESQKKNKPACLTGRLASFLRLRLQKIYPLFFPELKNAALIREVHTYGALVPIGQHKKAIQHQGLGKKLIKKAEKIAKEQDFKKIAVIAGVGTREYYRKLGFKLKNTYLIKSL